MKTVRIEGKEYLCTYSPLWWQIKGLTQTASGYGRKLNTGYKVEYQGRMRRIYCAQISNAGTCYILIKCQMIICS